MAMAGASGQAGRRLPSLRVEQLFPSGTGRKCWLKIVGLGPTVVEKESVPLGPCLESGQHPVCALGACPHRGDLPRP